MRPEQTDEALREAFWPRGYRLGARLGVGATSVVYTANHHASGRAVALKVARPDVIHPAVHARLVTAWQVGRGLRHPHLVTTFDGGWLPDGRAYVVMERLAGEDLERVLEREGYLDVGRALRIARQVAEGLVVLHRRGAIHRDIKPENLFICRSDGAIDHVKLIDFGILSLDGQHPERAHADTGPVVVGTPSYLAPELATGGRPSAASDLYALGAVLHHLITGHPPFPGDDPVVVMAQHVQDLPPTLVPGDPFGPPMPAILVDLVAQLLAKRPEDRPRDAAAVAHALGVASAVLEGVSGASAEAAGLPPVPEPGSPEVWSAFAGALDTWARASLASRPRVGMAQNLDWVDSARRALENQARHTLELRARADLSANRRLVARGRLLAHAREIDQALSAARGSLLEAAAEVEEALRRVDLMDEQHREAVRAVAGVLPGPEAGVRVVAALAGVRAALSGRNDAERVLGAARDAERDAGEQVAMLLAERVEVDRSIADVDLEEQDQGQRDEQLASRADDLMATAQRALENACLHLYARALEWGGARS